jgi:hypothetical protein
LRSETPAARADPAVELDFSAALADAVPLRRWKKIVARAVKDTEEGDPMARLWLGDLLMGKQPAALTVLAVTELAATMDDELRVKAAYRRKRVRRNRILSRISEYPDLGAGRQAGHGNVGVSSPIRRSTSRDANPVETVIRPRPRFKSTRWGTARLRHRFKSYQGPAWETGSQGSTIRLLRSR